MKIAAANIVEYESADGPWTAHWIVRPTVEVVDFAVRRMDGIRYPSVGLFLSPEASSRDTPDFEIIGGGGGYYIQATVRGDTYHYFDAGASSSLVRVWQSDQGFECSEKEQCHDLELAVAAVRFYCKTGDLLPAFPWQSRVSEI